MILRADHYGVDGLVLEDAPELDLALRPAAGQLLDIVQTRAEDGLVDIAGGRDLDARHRAEALDVVPSATSQADESDPNAVIRAGESSGRGRSCAR